MDVVPGLPEQVSGQGAVFFDELCRTAPQVPEPVG